LESVGFDKDLAARFEREFPGCAEAKAEDLLSVVSAFQSWARSDAAASCGSGRKAPLSFSEKLVICCFELGFSVDQVVDACYGVGMNKQDLVRACEKVFPNAVWASELKAGVDERFDDDLRPKEKERR
jgi:hypothetical protein